LPSLHKELLDLSLESSKNTESKGDIKNDSCESWFNSGIEAHDSSL
jgi:hypothetical protein